MKKLLTIGIPVYNGESDIEKTILSCLNVDLNEDEFEILVVDNCSIDNTVKVIKVLQKKIKNLRLVINYKNYGRIGNWNRIIELSNSKFLMFLMCKDFMVKCNIRKNLLLRLKNTDTHYVFQSGYFYNGKDYPYFNQNLLYNQKWKTDVFLQQRFEYFPGNKINFVSLVTNIFDKEVLIKHNLTFDTNLSYRSDEKFLTDYYTHHKYVVFLDKLLYVWNSHYNNRYSYQNTKNLYFDTVIVNDYYYNNIVKKTYHKSRTNFIMYLHMISVLLMGKIKKILKHKNVPEMKIIDVKEFFNMHILKNSLLFYLSFSLIPLYIAYYYFNVITNFKFFIKTK